MKLANPSTAKSLEHLWELRRLGRARFPRRRLRRRPGVEAQPVKRRLPLITQLGSPCGQETRNAVGAIRVVVGAITGAAVVSKPGKVLLFQSLTALRRHPIQSLIVSRSHPDFEGGEMAISANKKFDCGAGLGAIEARSDK